jgi:hypothetical protein
VSEIALYDGRTLHVHDLDDCLGPTCCIHNPSDHPLKDAPYSWWDIGMMARVCSHGRHHPDPDSMDFALLEARFLLVEACSSVHLDHCDGCCHS